jgi:polyhydroxybutyrate depolymerase
MRILRPSLVSFAWILISAFAMESRGQKAGDGGPEAGLEHMSVQVDGITREALVHLPRSSSGTPAPVVFVFHGHGGTAANAARSFRMHQEWPEAIAVYPQGLKTPGRLTDPEGKRSGWQAGAGLEGDRDLKFFDAVLAELGKKHPTDTRRVYATGHSNGGAFSYLLWEQRSKTVKAIAPSGAAARLKSTLPPKPVFHIAGTNDPLVKYEWQTATMAAVRKINQTEAQGKTWAENCSVFAAPNGTPLVTFIHDDGHRFPSAAPPLIARFFKEH